MQIIACLIYQIRSFPKRAYPQNDVRSFSGAEWALGYHVLAFHFIQPLLFGTLIEGRRKKKYRKITEERFVPREKQKAHVGRAHVPRENFRRGEADLCRLQHHTILSYFAHNIFFLIYPLLHTQVTFGGLPSPLWYYSKG